MDRLKQTEFGTLVNNQRKDVQVKLNYLLQDRSLLSSSQKEILNNRIEQRGKVIRNQFRNTHKLN